MTMHRNAENRRPEKKWRELEKELVRILDRDRVKSDLLDREMYAFDSSPFTALPDLVAFPETARETAKILEAARRHQCPVMPRGAGTCLSGGAVPVLGGISLSMTRMNRILDIDSFSHTALVEPGVVNLDLQKVLDPLNLMFPPDPASQKVSTIGGNVAENAGGIQGARYGVTKNYVLGLELVLADGSIVTTGMLSKAEAFGPDFTGIFAGSEGAFAVITKILVSLRPKPESYRTALAVFADLNQAALAVSGIIGKGIIPTALELMDQAMLRAVDDYARIGFPEDAEAVLLMEVDGYTVDLDRQLDLMVQVCRENGARAVEKAAGEAEREALWKARRSGNGALGRIRPAYTVHDVTVPRNQVAPLLTRIRTIGQVHDIIIAQMAHAGDGNAHPHLLYYPDDENISQRIHDATADIFQAALELGGTISGEHGIGLEKMPFMTMQFSKEDLRFMQRIKDAFDPEGWLNPGKVLPNRGAGGAKTRDQISGDQICVRNAGGVRPAAQPSDSTGILEFIPGNMTVKVQGDVPLNRIQALAGEINAWLPLEQEIFGDIAVGQLVAQGARGLGAMAWGSLKEYIFGMEFTTLAGDRVTAGGHTAKNVAGFDFTRLLWKSRGELGRIDTLTFKLAPVPEYRVLAVKDFDSLKDCLAAARRILSGRLSLVTLMAEGRSDDPGGWQLMAGLAGSRELVSSQLPELETLMEPNWGGIRNKRRNPLPKIFTGEDECLFRKEWAGRGEAFAHPLVLGRGTRSALFDTLEQNASLLDGQVSDAGTALRIELDLGFSAMTISGKDSGTDVGFLSSMDIGRAIGKDWETEPGFFISRPGDPVQSPVCRRLYPLLTGRGAHE